MSGRTYVRGHYRRRRGGSGAGVALLLVGALGALIFLYDHPLLLVLGILGVFALVGLVVGAKIYRRRRTVERWRRSGITQIDLMAGWQFEQRMVVLFQDLGYQVLQTGQSGDGGCDLLLSGPASVAVQCKRYGKPVGNKAVQEAHMARTLNHTAEAWVVTNNAFTAQAIRDAQRSGVHLVGRGGLYQMLLEADRRNRKELS